MIDQDKKNKKKDDKKGLKKIIINTMLVVIGMLVLAIVLWFLSGEGKENAKKVVFEVGDEPVYLDEVNFCILQNMLNLNLNEAALSVDPKDGGTADAYYKKEILKQIMDYKVEAKIAKKKGIHISDEDLKKVKKDANEYALQIDGRIMRELGISKECIIDVYEERYLAYLLEQEETKDVKPKKQDFSTVYFMFFPKVETTEDGDYKRDTDGETPIFLSEAEIEKNKNNANAAYKDLKAGEELEAVAKKYGVKEISGADSNVPESFGTLFAKTITDLEEGEISEVIDTPSAYVILKMLQKNNEELANQLMDAYKKDLKKEKIERLKLEWYKELEVEELPKFKGNIWKKITLHDFVKYVEE